MVMQNNHEKKQSDISNKDAPNYKGNEIIKSNKVIKAIK